ncbi:MAG: IscS subfamily cysteine desulfurase [Gammaproteobacteria bacterium]|nr:MAG: IscS subfamily cysteine desulfurase [Gammaproteobacteria bacterium]RLA12049.1 MAG: IscS subfamily cysteine desulfurase [Gammaproteobacteria bacterium]RLA16851.1 MAG: IscS subfamily cysteine desulfurase [Gammaproteobacteria bacterium]
MTTLAATGNPAQQPSAAYFDYAATTPVDPQVVDVMQHSLAKEFGNPSAQQYALGQSALANIVLAREKLAALINADAAAITWTSGATESNNLAIFGAADFYQRRGRHLICTATEHSSVLTPMQQLQRRGCDLTLLQPDTDGIVSPDQLSDALRPDTVLVSIQHANNETGVVQDIPALAERLRESPALLHIDAAQTLGKTAIDVQMLDCDLMSLSAHKMYGPKGIGALYVRRKPRINLTPLLYGGGQQSARRPGTLPTHQIIGFGKACELASDQLDDENKRLWQFHQQLLTQIDQSEKTVNYRLNGHATQRLPGIVNISIGNGELDPLDQLAGYALANGSACNSSQPGPSHVLISMGLSRTAAANALRISFGRFTTQAEINSLATAIADLPGKYQWHDANKRPQDA